MPGRPTYMTASQPATSSHPTAFRRAGFAVISRFQIHRRPALIANDATLFGKRLEVFLNRLQLFQLREAGAHLVHGLLEALDLLGLVFHEFLDTLEGVVFLGGSLIAIDALELLLFARRTIGLPVALLLSFSALLASH